MKFKLDTVANNYSEPAWLVLAALGFLCKSTITFNGETLYVKDGTQQPEIEFASVEQLAAFAADHESLIMYKDRIVIYDEYCE